MVVNLSVLKKAIVIALFTYCFLALESRLGARKQEPVSFELNFNNFLKKSRFLIVPNMENCETGAPPLVLTMVMSSSGNYRKREAIRATWANHWNSKTIREGRVVLSFVVSRPGRKTELRGLIQEVKAYNDLLVLDLEESYENLILKVYASLIFAEKYCSVASFLMKVDDDVVVHLDRMVHYLIDTTSSRDSFLCKVWTKVRPIRDPDSKWYVSPEDWSADMFPRYCGGPMYLLGASALKKILRKLPSLALFKMEDVFFTGIAAQSAKIQHQYWSKHIRHSNEELWWGVDECDKDKEPFLFSVHSMNSTENMKKGYDMLKRLKCTNREEMRRRKSRTRH